MVIVERCGPPARCSPSERGKPHLHGVARALAGVCYTQRRMSASVLTPALEPSRRSRIVLTLVVLATTLALDLWTKAWAWEHLRRGRPVVVIDPLLEFSFSFNLGAAFGFLNDASWSRLFFIAVTVLALIYMAWLARTLPTQKAYGFVAVGLVAAGASGNLHDRLVRANDGGHYGVVDFIKVNYPWGGSWPTFNVADALLLVGVLMLLIFLRREADPDEADESAGASETADASDAADAADAPEAADAPVAGAAAAASEAADTSEGADAPEAAAASEAAKARPADANAEIAQPEQSDDAAEARASAPKLTDAPAASPD